MTKKENSSPMFRNKIGGLCCLKPLIFYYLSIFFATMFKMWNHLVYGCSGNQSRIRSNWRIVIVKKASLKLFRSLHFKHLHLKKTLETRIQMSNQFKVHMKLDPKNDILTKLFVFRVTLTIKIHILSFKSDYFNVKVSSVLDNILIAIIRSFWKVAWIIVEVIKIAKPREIL